MCIRDSVGGHIKKNFTVDVSELSEDASEEALMACSCATGSPFGQAAVLGVPLASIVEMADLEEGVNTVTAYGADGFGQPLPLRYALEHDAMLVYQVNGQEPVSYTHLDVYKRQILRRRCSSCWPGTSRPARSIASWSRP